MRPANAVRTSSRFDRRKCRAAGLGRCEKMQVTGQAAVVECRSRMPPAAPTTTCPCFSTYGLRLTSLPPATRCCRPPSRKPATRSASGTLVKLVHDDGKVTGAIFTLTTATCRSTPRARCWQPAAIRRIPMMRALQPSALACCTASSYAINDDGYGLKAGMGLAGRDPMPRR